VAPPAQAVQPGQEFIDAVEKERAFIDKYIIVMQGPQCG
jgi:hypothetical protein